MRTELFRLFRVTFAVIAFIFLFVSILRFFARQSQPINTANEETINKTFAAFVDPFRSPDSEQILASFLQNPPHCPTSDTKFYLWLQVGSDTLGELKPKTHIGFAELDGELGKKIKTSGAKVVFEVHLSDEQSLYLAIQDLNKKFPGAIFYTQFHKLNDKLKRYHPDLKFATHQAGLIKNQIFLQLGLVDASLRRFEFFLIDEVNLKLLSPRILNQLKNLGVQLILKANDRELGADHDFLSGLLTGAPSQLLASPCHYRQVSKK